MANMNNKNRTKLLRSDPNFVKEMRDLAKFRYFKNLEKKEPTDAEMTRLLMRTDAWQRAQLELRNKPRRENS